jgi:hypothetical protein
LLELGEDRMSGTRQPGGGRGYRRFGDVRRISDV